MSQDFSTMSLNEIAAALVAGYRPTGVSTTSKGRKVVKFDEEAVHAVQRFMAARDEAARLLDMTKHVART